MANALALSTLPDWENHLNTLDPTHIELGLKRVALVKTTLFADVVLPPVVLIAGTNGKGSTAALCEAALLKAGNTVGTYTSPHLVHLNERIRVDGQAIADPDFVSALQAVEDAREQTPLTYFEFITLAAMAHFSAQEVDVALLEVGLGGRLDAVNVFDPAAACVTNVGLDHMDWLGDTREKIGREKAGVFRPNVPAVYADEDSVETVVAYANSIDAMLMSYDPLAQVAEAPLMTGVPQSIRWCATTLLKSLPSPIRPSTEDISQGFATAALAGRYQTLSEKPLLVVDVAHNTEATTLLASKLRADKRVKRWVAVFAAYKDKPIAEAVEPLLGNIAQWFCCELSGPRAMPIDALSNLLKDSGANVHAAGKPNEALALALEEAATKDAGVLVFGSFETVGGVMKSLQEKAND